MARETERKFRVEGEGWRSAATGSHALVQAYLALGDKAEVRLRISDGQSAWLTIKSGGAALTRAEFEYPVPVPDARAMLPLCTGTPISKRRYTVPAGQGLVWEIDAFEGSLAGLVLAEIELADPAQEFARPAWLGREVTGEAAYYNAALALSGAVPEKGAPG